MIKPSKSRPCQVSGQGEQWRPLELHPRKLKNNPQKRSNQKRTLEPQTREPQKNQKAQKDPRAPVKTQQPPRKATQEPWKPRSNSTLAHRTSRAPTRPAPEKRKPHIANHKHKRETQGTKHGGPKQTQRGRTNQTKQATLKNFKNHEDASSKVTTSIQRNTSPKAQQMRSQTQTRACPGKPKGNDITKRAPNRQPGPCRRRRKNRNTKLCIEPVGPIQIYIPHTHKS